MLTPVLTLPELTGPFAGEQLGPLLDGAGRPNRPVVLIDGRTDQRLLDDDRVLATLRASLAITVLVGASSPAVDLCIGGGHRPLAGHTGAAETEQADPMSAAQHFAAAVMSAPRASLTLAWLLRAGRTATVPGGLAAESAAYSMLLTGSDFQQWLRDRPVHPARTADTAKRVRVSREGALLRIVLARPQRRNAVDTLMRHELLQALQVGVADDQVLIEISADGPSFSAGGDLAEFGSVRDPAAAHLVRVAASVGQLLHELRARVTVRVHGACIGAGIELPAFSGRIVAHPDAFFGLPEVSMGLIPGAGGTVSIPHRIGSDRTLWWAVTGTILDAETALAWGLIDAID